jgi:hypothetical protein
VVLVAKPAYLKRIRVVLVVAFYLRIKANLAW